MAKVTVSSVFGVIQRIEAFILAWAMIAIAVLTIANVLSRSIFGISLTFAEELDQFLIVLVCFVGLSYGASKGRHIRMTAIYDQLPHRPRKALMVGIAGGTSLLCFYLMYEAVRYVMVVADLGSVSPSLRVPVWIVYCAAPLGLLLAGIQYALTVVRNLRAGKVYLSYDRTDEYEEQTTGAV